MQTKRRYYIDRGEEKEDRSLYIFSKLTGEMSGWLLSKQKRLLAKSKGGKGKKKGGRGRQACMSSPCVFSAQLNCKRSEGKTKLTLSVLYILYHCYSTHLVHSYNPMLHHE